MSPGRWLRSLAALVGAAALVAAAAGPVHAAYQATAYSNGTAFSFNCIGINDTYPSRLLASALAGYRNLGYATTGVTGTAFTKAQVLGRTLNDWGMYVHSHGDNYLYSGSTRDYGFKEDAGLCTRSRCRSAAARARCRWPSRPRASCRNTDITKMSPSCPIDRMVVVRRPYRKPRCSSWLNSNSGSRSAALLAALHEVEGRQQHDRQ